MKFWISVLMGSLSAAAVFTPALAQTNNNGFRLDLSLVARTGTPATGLQDISGPVYIQNTSSIRLELRYRIADLVADNIASRGLVSSELVISNDRGSVAGQVFRSTLTDSQLAPGAFAPANDGALNPDLSGQSDTSNTGLVEPFRGSLVSDTGLANGQFYNGPSQPRGPAGIRMDGLGFSVLPITLASPGHQSWAGSPTQVINFASTNTNPATWTIFAFDYVPSSTFEGPVTFSASALRDPLTGTAFAFFTRTGATNTARISQSQIATGASLTINVIPSAPSAAIFALGTALAFRRRRPR